MNQAIAEHKIIRGTNQNIDAVSKEITYRQSPCNIEAEQAVLGAALTNNEAINKVGDFLLAEHFYEPVHQRIYDAILRFNERGLIATPVTLKNHFDKDETLKEYGGATYLSRIAGMASSIINIKDHASIVYSLAISRNLIDIGEDMVNEAHSSNGELRASEQIEKSEQRLFNLASEGSSDSNFAALRFSLTDAIKTAEAAAKKQGGISGIATSFEDMDELLGGLHNSDLIIIAARPSMGKTAFALNLALNAAVNLTKEYQQKLSALKEGSANIPEQKSVGFFSLEMSSEQLATRMLAMESSIDAGNIKRGKLKKDKQDNEFERLINASARLHELPFFIDDTPALTISAVRTRARRLKRKHNLGLLVIDYLQLLRGVSSQAQNSRVQEISEITMGLKAIAKELNIPVIALSQLSRAVESRDDKRPQLSDLRESGSIEQDADMVMFIYREAYYLERKMPNKPKAQNVSGENKNDLVSYESDIKIYEEWYEQNGEHYEAVKNKTEILVSKNRNGPIGNVTLIFDSATTKFKSYASANRYEEAVY